MAKLSEAMESALLTIANGDRFTGLRTLKALERRGLVVPRPHPKYKGIVYYDHVTLTKEGWLKVGTIAREMFDWVAELYSGETYHRFKRLERKVNNIENMNRWGALIARAEWHTGS
jgi:hypothetical protein